MSKWKIKFICRLLLPDTSKRDYTAFHGGVRIFLERNILLRIYGILFVIESVFFNRVTVQILNFSRSLNFWKPIITKGNSLNFVKYTAHTKILHVKSTEINWFYILHSELCVVREAFSDKCDAVRLVFGACKSCNLTEVLTWPLEPNSAAGR
jgi:hypothetical protein